MPIRCCFVIITMVDTIFSASTRAHSSSCQHLVLFIMFSYNTLIFARTMPHFSQLRFGGGIHENFILASYYALYNYIYVCASLFGWFSFYLWLVLVFLFSRVSYGFTPLRHCMSRHYTSQQLLESQNLKVVMKDYILNVVRFNIKFTYHHLCW
jgi:hypothetical protein